MLNSIPALLEARNLSKYQFLAIFEKSEFSKLLKNRENRSAAASAARPLKYKLQRAWLGRRPRVKGPILFGDVCL